MKNFEELENFIANNKDWKEKLKQKPYNLKSITQFPINPNWYLLNYNLFESDLDNKIVRQCRGTCVEVDGDYVRVICAPYLKFFDINDPHADSINWNSDKLKCEEKLDGQLLKMFKYDGVDYWVTNGGVSIDTPIDYCTEDVHNYKELLSKALLTSGSEKGQGCVYDDISFSCRMNWVYRIPNGWTLMFELTSPQNKIICNYDECKLWFHGVRDSEGNELSPEYVKTMLGVPYDIPKRYNLSKKEDILAALEKFNGKEHEGFVVVDEATWTRVKMKSPNYLALKYIQDNDTPEGIWTLVVSEQYDDFPELKDKAEEQLNEIKLFNIKLAGYITLAKEEYKKFQSRKDYAIWVNKEVEPLLRPFYFRAIEADAETIINNEWDRLKKLSKGYAVYSELFKIL